MQVSSPLVLISALQVTIPISDYHIMPGYDFQVIEWFNPFDEKDRL